MQNKVYISVLLALSLVSGTSAATRIVLTNDDGWAVAQLRAEYTALTAAGYSVLISAPAVNKSGSGSSSTTPKPLTTECQFGTCPKGSPAYGSDPSDSQINYVNGYPVDAVKYGIQTLSPAIFGSVPDLVVSGTNIGNNLGSLTTKLSGTVGAACEATLEGIPSIAVSGSSGSAVSYTTLANTSASSTKDANIYSALVNKLVAQLLSNSGSILPKGITLNVNFASTSSCPSASSYKFVLTRISSGIFATDVQTCGTSKLTSESTAINKGCIVTVSVMDASTKGDVNAATQALVLARLSPILGCL
ncbi:hypothetical protein D9619_009022 [Psilocybe cf. subviscida]|uniref:Survival protein SurE-like phosphatase/nucleotidase domain-containing protein n=1 Tax=Psilocybe cf. subviscida TaxID=2480587 RepID=A0A8H5BU18_9AGAR|nr:hypothetical protein D9619_009022 [Psilocybe cf. subviscida]